MTTIHRKEERIKEKKKKIKEIFISPPYRINKKRIKSLP